MNKLEFDNKNQNILHRKTTQELRNHQDREIELLKEKFENDKVVTLEDQRSQIESLRNETDIKKINELEQREQALNELKSSLEKTQKTISAEKEFMSKNHEIDLLSTKQKQQGHISDISSKSTDNVKKINQRYNDTLSTIHQTGQKDIHRINAKNRLVMNKIQESHTDNVKKNQGEFTEELRKEKNRFEAQLGQQQFQFELDAKSQENLHKNRMIARQRYFDEEFAKLEKDQQLVLENTKNEFNIKYQNLKNSHESDIGNLKKRVDDITDKVKSGLSKNLQSLGDRTADQFYQIDKLTPVKSEDEANYIISVAVPEHEKGFLQLSAHDKAAKLTFTRNFQDQVNDEKSNHKISKVESYSTKINLDHYVDSKKIKQNYENGVMTYIIPKKV